ncbi:hypothetical protein LA03_10710 [Burkholderia gladioli]|nr:hypothetical protein LA03_10710 [Burkholderia gladioli]
MVCYEVQCGLREIQQCKVFIDCAFRLPYQRGQTFLVGRKSFIEQRFVSVRSVKSGLLFAFRICSPGEPPKIDLLEAVQYLDVEFRMFKENPRTFAILAVDQNEFFRVTRVTRCQRGQHLPVFRNRICAGSDLRFVVNSPTIQRIIIDHIDRPRRRDRLNLSRPLQGFYVEIWTTVFGIGARWLL